MKVFDTRDINIETCSEEADILTKDVLPANLAESFSPIRYWRKQCCVLLIKGSKVKNQ